MIPKTEWDKAILQQASNIAMQNKADIERIKSQILHLQQTMERYDRNLRMYLNSGRIEDEFRRT